VRKPVLKSSEDLALEAFENVFQRLFPLRDYDQILVYFVHTLSQMQSSNGVRLCCLSLANVIHKGHILPTEKMLYQLLQKNPDNAYLWLLLGMCAGDRGDPRRARAFQERCLNLNPQLFLAHQSYLWSFLLDARLSFEQQMAPFKAHGQLLEYLSPAQPIKISKPEPEKRIKIGYVSGDFYAHSVIHMFGALFKYSNSDKFELFAYSSIEREGELNAWFKQSVAHWRDISSIRAEQAAALIRSDGIDILIDLNGQTYGHRFDVFALKPAPIQISGLGFGWSSGLTRMDYLLTDCDIVPAERVETYTEKPLYLSSYFHWYPEPDLQDIQPQRESEPEYPCFAAMHQLFKLNFESLVVWAEILKRAPESKILFKSKGLDNPQLQSYYRLLFKNRGVAPERLLFSGATSQREHVLLYQHLDVFLDPFPYQAGISSCEALWMGVPVVSLSGGTRSANSILKRVGHPELLAASHEEYISCAVELIQDKLRLMDYRLRLRAELLASEICDPERFCRESEAYYRQVWRQYTETQC
jgi:protein O-GlcNAc transferase